MATTPHEEQLSYTAAGADLGVELLPLTEESPAEYLARLKALHKRVGALINTIEQRRPVLGPVPVRPPRAVSDRREPEIGERRLGTEDRRHGDPDPRPVPIERRFGRRDRRGGAAVDRRDEYDRRRDPSPVPWRGGLHWNRTTAIWVVQILAWVAIAVFALVYGIGH
jgi:hypothetical protein